jgi:hypothetical protein
MTRSIGGVLDLCALALLSGADIDRQATQHRPSDREALLAAAVELRQSGLEFRDIGQALGLSEAAVRQLLGESAGTITEVR